LSLRLHQAGRRPIGYPFAVARELFDAIDGIFVLK